MKPRNLGDLRRTTPFSAWGSSRGGSIDRIYIGQFIDKHASDIRGRALEIAGDEYVRVWPRTRMRVDGTHGGFATEGEAATARRAETREARSMNEALHRGEAIAWAPR